MNPFRYILSHPEEVLQLTGEHLFLVVVSTLVAAAIGIPLGIVLTRRPGWSRWVLGIACNRAVGWPGRLSPENLAAVPAS